MSTPLYLFCRKCKLELSLLDYINLKDDEHLATTLTCDRCLTRHDLQLTLRARKANKRKENLKCR